METTTPLRRRAGRRIVRTLILLMAIVSGIGLFSMFGKALIEAGIAQDMRHWMDDFRWLTTSFRYSLIALAIWRWESIVRFLVRRSKRNYSSEEVEKLVDYRWRLLGWLVVFEVFLELYSVTW